MPIDAQAIAPKPRRRWWRWLRPTFGLKALLALIALVGIGLAMIVVPVERQKQAVAAVRSLGGD